MRKGGHYKDGARVAGDFVMECPLPQPSDSAEHFLGFAALGLIALSQHFGQDVFRAIRIAHIDIGLGQVQLGGNLIGAGEEVELRLIITQCSVFGREGRPDRRMLKALGQAVQLGVDIIQFGREGIGLGIGLRLVRQ